MKGRVKRKGSGKVVYIRGSIKTVPYSKVEAAEGG